MATAGAGAAGEAIAAWRGRRWRRLGVARPQVAQAAGGAAAGQVQQAAWRVQVPPVLPPESRQRPLLPAESA